MAHGTGDPMLALVPGSGQQTSLAGQLVPAMAPIGHNPPPLALCINNPFAAVLSNGVSTMPMNGPMQQLCEEYKSMLPMSNSKAMQDKMHQAAWQLKRQAEAAEATGNIALALKLYKDASKTITAMRQWKAAIDQGMSKADLVALWRQQEYELDPEAGVKPFDFAMSLASNDPFRSTMVSMLNKLNTKADSTPSRGSHKQGIGLISSITCHECGQEGHMRFDKDRRSTCPELIKKGILVDPRPRPVKAKQS